MRGRLTAMIAIAVAVAVAACGGSAPADDPGTGVGAGTGTATQAPVETAVSSDGPVTVEVDGTTYGFDIGTCDVTGPDSVKVSAGRSDGSFSSVDVRLSAESGASMTVNMPSPANATTLQLSAGDANQATSWNVRVDGTTAVIEAAMADQSQGAEGDALRDVTITIRCAERGFGGMAPPPAEEPEVPPAEPAPTALGESAITLELAGSTYSFSYPGCPMSEPAISFILVDPSTLARLFVGNGEAGLVLADGTQVQATGVEFQVSGPRATWSGTMSGSAGDGSATIEITCG